MGFPLSILSLLYIFFESNKSKTDLVLFWWKALSVQMKNQVSEDSRTTQIFGQETN